MITPITKDHKEYLDWMTEYDNQVTKFIGKDGTGHRGVLLNVSEDGKKAIVKGLTGEYFNKEVTILESDPDQWAEVV